MQVQSQQPSGCFARFAVTVGGAAHDIIVFVEGASGVGLTGNGAATSVHRQRGHSGVVVVSAAHVAELVDTIDLGIVE